MRVSMTEILNMGLDRAVAEVNVFWIKWKDGARREAGLSMFATYTQMYNGLGLRLNILESL